MNPANLVIVSRRVRQDFTEEDLVVIGGWRLSRTEVMLAVLADRTFGDFPASAKRHL
jgi:hypothetical protein